MILIVIFKDNYLYVVNEKRKLIIFLNINNLVDIF